MNWGYFFAWVAVIFALFFVTGWPVSQNLTDVWGNHYEAKNLTYYAVLYFHYVIGALFFSFLGIGLFRHMLWENDNKQLIYLLSYSMIVASVAALLLTHFYAPNEPSESHRALSAAEQAAPVAAAVAVEEAPKVELHESPLENP